MAPDFVAKLDRFREVVGVPLLVVSGYRCPAHNAAVSSTGASGPHTTGRAVDLAASGGPAFNLLRLALSHPAVSFSGVGVKQHGLHAGRFVHLDDLPAAPGRPRPTVWSY